MEKRGPRCKFLKQKEKKNEIFERTEKKESLEVGLGGVGLKS